MTKLVSIMMPAYNAENYIEQAIESVLAQSYQNWELIIVNDGSTDNTPELVARYSDPRIQIVHQGNSGEATARNTALANMTGDWVAYLDADDLFLPNHLSATIEYLNQYPKYDAVYTDGFHIDSQGNRLQTLSSRRRGPFSGRLYEELVRSSDVFGPPLCVVIRRKIITDHELIYDKRIVIGPDWDFFIHYSDFAQFGYLNQKTCLYRVHGTNITLQVDLRKRAAYLAICRENAIKMESFNHCPAQTRVDVFYDLLVNLLPGMPNQQTEVTKWKEFNLLPVTEQARLYRLMASRAILAGPPHTEVLAWLNRAQELNPTDTPSKWLLFLFKISPRLCQILLQGKNILSRQKLKTALPLADIKPRI